MPSEERCQGTNPGSSYFFGRSTIIAGRNLVHKRQDSACGDIISKGAWNIIQGSSSKGPSMEDILLKLSCWMFPFWKKIPVHCKYICTYALNFFL